MNLRYSLVVSLVPLLLVMTTSCGSGKQADLNLCNEETVKQNEPVSEQLACIYLLLEDGKSLIFPDAVLNQSITYKAAIESLEASGYLVEVDRVSFEGNELAGYYPTAEGIEYLRKHKHPTRHWLERNWLPLSVAIVNALIAVSAIIISVWLRRRGHNTT